jgi:hypothetical protein
MKHYLGGECGNSRGSGWMGSVECPLRVGGDRRETGETGEISCFRCTTHKRYMYLQTKEVKIKGGRCLLGIYFEYKRISEKRSQS